MARTREDRLALSMMRHMGITLSAEEYQDDDPGDDTTDSGDLNGARLQRLGGKPGTTNITDGKGNVSITTLLADLLGALGISVPASSSDGEFKQALYAAAMAKIKEMTGGAPTPGTTGKSTNADILMDPNTRSSPLLQEEHQPMFMSLSDIEGIGDHRVKGLALSMAVDCDNLRRKQEDAEVARQRQHEAKVSAVRGKRQAVVNRILALNPSRHIRQEVEDILNRESGAALSMVANGNPLDGTESELLSLEQRVRGDLARDRQV